MEILLNEFFRMPRTLDYQKYFCPTTGIVYFNVSKNNFVGKLENVIVLSHYPKYVLKLFSSRFRLKSTLCIRHENRTITFDRSSRKEPEFWTGSLETDGIYINLHKLSKSTHTQNLREETFKSRFCRGRENSCSWHAVASMGFSREIINILLGDFSAYQVNPWVSGYSVWDSGPTHQDFTNQMSSIEFHDYCKGSVTVCF